MGCGKSTSIHRSSKVALVALGHRLCEAYPSCHWLRAWLHSVMEHKYIEIQTIHIHCYNYNLTKAFNTNCSVSHTEPESIIEVVRDVIKTPSCWLQGVIGLGFFLHYLISVQPWYRQPTCLAADVTVVLF